MKNLSRFSFAVFMSVFLGLMLWKSNVAPQAQAEELEAPVAALEDLQESTEESNILKEENKESAVLDSVEKTDWTNIVYFTGIGCPHCAKTDPVVLNKRLRQGDVMIFEYEVYQDKVNGPLLLDYNKTYKAKLAVPQIIAGAEASDIVSGDAPLLKSLDTLISIHKGNDVVLGDVPVSFGALSMIKLPYKPKIWFKDRIAIREDSASLQSDTIKAFLVDGTVPEGCTEQEDKSAPLSGGQIKFGSACSFDGWVLMHD